MNEERTCHTCRFKGNSIASVPCCTCSYETEEYDNWEPATDVVNVVKEVQEDKDYKKKRLRGFMKGKKYYYFYCVEYSNRSKSSGVVYAPSTMSPREVYDDTLAVIKEHNSHPFVITQFNKL